MKVYAEPIEAKAIHDTLLLHWWEEMIVSGDIHKTFGPGCLELSTFMQIVQPPSKLMFDTDENGKIWIAAALDPAPFAGVFFTLWVAEEKRQTRTAWVAILDILHAALHPETGWPIVVVVTTEDRVGQLHQHFGFQHVGFIPKLRWGQDLYIAYMNQELLAAAVEKLNAKTNRVQVAVDSVNRARAGH
jgi:hypothetical protein